MTKSAKWLIAVLILITAASVITTVFVVARQPDTDDEEEMVKAPSHVSVENGRTIIKLDAQTQARDNIRVVALTSQSQHAELRSTAVLLPVTDLATLRNTYIASRTKVQRDRVDLGVSRTAYERTKALYDQNQNMSLKAVQEAEALWRNHEHQVLADEQDAKFQLDAARQRWGPAVAEWIAEDKSVLTPILEQREFLVQVIFPPGETAKPPETISLQAPGNKSIAARFVSAIPQVNPQIQGVSFLYLSPNSSGFAVGMNLVANVSTGNSMEGVIVPQGGIVWWQGKAWLYEQVASDSFARREVPTTSPVEAGYFIDGKSFAPGTKIVTVGAQALLSEEFRGEIKQQD